MLATFSRISEITSKYYEQSMMRELRSVSLAELYLWKIKFKMKYCRGGRHGNCPQNRVDFHMEIDISPKDILKVKKRKQDWNGLFSIPNY